jgi:hypothetical protein
MSAGDGFAVLGAGQEDPRPNDVLGPGSGLAQRLEDDLEAAVRLSLGIRIA